MAAFEGASALEELKKMTVVVADTGEVSAIAAFTPQDATTNPSLIFKAAGLPEYHHLVADAVAYSAAIQDPKERLDVTMDKLAVNFGAEISKVGMQLGLG